MEVRKIVRFSKRHGTRHEWIQDQIEVCLEMDEGAADYRISEMVKIEARNQLEDAGLRRGEFTIDEIEEL